MSQQADPKDRKPDDDTPPDHKEIRPAGAENMEHPPEEWTELDEELDESFPASDPPANY